MPDPQFSMYCWYRIIQSFINTPHRYKITVEKGTPDENIRTVTLFTQISTPLSPWQMVIKPIKLAVLLES